MVYNNYCLIKVNYDSILPFITTNVSLGCLNYNSTVNYRLNKMLSTKLRNINN